jgi:hypothetical protein
MIAEPSVATFKSVLSRRHASGTITFEQPTQEAPGQVPLYEFTWNHTTLQMLKRDRGVTYLQALHPATRLLDSAAEMEALFGDELIPHLEFLRVGGQITASGLPIVRFTTEIRLKQIIAEHRAHGVVDRQPARVHAVGWRRAQTGRCRPTRIKPIRTGCSTPER